MPDNSTKPVSGRCGHKAPWSRSVLRLEPLVSGSLREGRVCSFLAKCSWGQAEQLESSSPSLTSPHLGASSKAGMDVMEDSPGGIPGEAQAEQE